MKIQLIDRNYDLVQEWKKQFEGCENVFIYHDDFFKISTDCFVSPANSYGFLDGGIDNQIYRFYQDKGIDIQQIVQSEIVNNHNGELLVGQSLYIPISFGYKEVPELIVAPTMRVPMILPKNSVNVYLAMKAILLCTPKIFQYRFDNKDRSISISGLGTGIGKVPYDICAKQMRKAYDDFWLGEYTFPKTWEEAQTRHQILYTDNVSDIQLPELDNETKNRYGLK